MKAAVNTVRVAQRGDSSSRLGADVENVTRDDPKSPSQMTVRLSFQLSPREQNEKGLTGRRSV